MQPMREGEVRDKMQRAGVPCMEMIVFDGKVHRFKVDGRGKRNGWYWFVERDGKIYGTFGNWKTGERHTLGKYEREMRAIVRERAVDDRQDALKAAIAARDEWAGLATTGESAYLNAKQVPSFGLRFARDFVVVPMYRDGIVGLQRIYWDGRKRFTTHCEKRGASFLIKGNDILALVEGYATGASVHMATGFSVLVCFDAGNMLEVAKNLGHEGPIIVCGDNDHGTVCQRHKADGVERPVDPSTKRPSWCSCNPGKTVAINAARILKAKMVVPHCNGTDFNDLHVEQDLVSVADQIYDAL